MNKKDKLAHDKMVAKTKRNAYNSGQPWSAEEVAAVMQGIYDDKTTFDIAMSIGRSYYAVQTARSHVRFAISHRGVLFEDQTPRRKSKAPKFQTPARGRGKLRAVR